MRERLLPLILAGISIASLAGCSAGAPDTSPAAASPHPTPTAAPTTLPDPPTDTPEPTNTPEPTPAPWPTVAVDSSIMHGIYVIEDQAAEIRGLVVKDEVPALFITPQQLHDYFAANVGKGYTIEEAEQNEMEAWLLRLIKKRDVNLKERAVEVHTEWIAGFYSPDIKELFVLGDPKRLSPASKETLAHEFTHALQDQHFNLTQMVQKYSHDSDHRLAIKALIEGDASITGWTYSAEYQKNVDYSRQKQPDPKQNAQKQATQPSDGQGSYVGKTIYFPYIQGSQFILQLTKVAGFSAVNSTYQDPPVSSE